MKIDYYYRGKLLSKLSYWSGRSTFVVRGGDGVKEVDKW